MYEEEVKERVDKMDDKKFVDTVIFFLNLSDRNHIEVVDDDGKPAGYRRYTRKDILEEGDYSFSREEFAYYYAEYASEWMERDCGFYRYVDFLTDTYERD